MCESVCFALFISLYLTIFFVYPVHGKLTVAVVFAIVVAVVVVVVIVVSVVDVVVVVVILDIVVVAFVVHNFSNTS